MNTSGILHVYPLKDKNVLVSIYSNFLLANIFYYWILSDFSCSEKTWKLRPKIPIKRNKIKIPQKFITPSVFPYKHVLKEFIIPALFKESSGILLLPLSSYVVAKLYSRIWLAMSCRCAIRLRNIHFCPNGSVEVVVTGTLSTLE